MKNVFKTGCLKYFITFFIIIILLEYAIGITAIIILIFIILFLIRKIIEKHPIEAYKKYKFRKFEEKYYKSEEFFYLKNSVAKYIQNCNELNEHVLKLKNVHLGINQLDYGIAHYSDMSYYNYSRPEYNKHSYADNIYNCSRNVCDNARLQPFKYVCKYFNIDMNEENLSDFENLLNNYEAATNGFDILKDEKNRILQGIENEIPDMIKQYSYERFQRELGFKTVDFESVEFLKYKFLYVSPGGNASTECTVIMDVENLNKFIKYLSDNIKFKQSISGQRALMTSSLRKKILSRDNYTCQKCGNSIKNEPNLLLEIDHKIPLAKGGMTTEDNLQVLCWRCNRNKGAKIENE